MITGSYSRYSGASSLSPMHFNLTSGQNKNDGVIQQIFEIIQRDPLFSYASHTTLQCLFALRSFFNERGNPATRIPELHIGNEIVRNISCLDLVSRLNTSAFEGLKRIDWEEQDDLRQNLACYQWEDGELETEDLETSIVYLFDEVFKIGLEEVDRLIRTPISIEEIAELIHCVIASDPYCSRKHNGNRILNLVSKFLDVGGLPTVSLENIKIGSKVIDKAMVFELVYFLWELFREQKEGKIVIWDDDDNSSGTFVICDTYGHDPIKNQEMSQRFVTIINRCEEIINLMLVRNQLSDEDFLPLIRCVVELPDVRCWLPRNIFAGRPLLEEYIEGCISKKQEKRFLHLMTYFVQRRVNPNLVFSFIEINKNRYKDLTCFQLTYLIWKHPEATWSEEDEKRFQSIFQALLLDPRTDLTLRFSEHRLRYSMQHFNDERNIHSTSSNSSSSSSSSNQVLSTLGGENIQSFNRKNYINYDYTGYHLERITIAHYAVIVNDYDTLRLLLKQEPRLIVAVCCMTRAKEALFGHIGHHKSTRWISSSSKQDMVLLRDLENSDEFHGDIGIRDKFPSESYSVVCPVLPGGGGVHRITGVTLLHLAARTGHEGSLAILESLGNRYVSLADADSDGKIPKHYLQFSIEEGIVRKNKGSQSMLEVLEPVTKLYRALPQVHRIIHREGYDLHYNTSKKVADFVHQRLGKDSFGTAKRTNHKWIDNLDIPELNRVIDNDYKGSGYDRGHLVPAEDATHSDQTMGDTFHPENAVPQNPNMNSGVWSRLEAHVRTLAHNNDCVEVFTGPLFLPRFEARGRIITYPVIGRGDVHVPTHLFKIIFIHNRRTTAEVYIIPNETHPRKTKFSTFKCPSAKVGIDYIQQYSGILFRE